MNAIFLPGDGVFHAVRWAVWRLYEDIEQDVLSTEPSGLDPISALLRSWRPSDSAKILLYFQAEEKTSRSFGLCVGVSCLPGQAKYCPAVKNSPVDCFRQKKRPKPKFWSFVLAFPVFLGRPSIVLPLKTVRWTVFGRRKGSSVRLSLVLALPIFPGSHPPSIVGADELNFCVRDGNRWTLIAINTNLCGWVLPIFVCQTIPRLTASGF